MAVEWLRLATVALALLVIFLTVIALLRRGRVLHRSVRATRHIATGVVEGIRERGEEAEGSIGRFFSKLARFLKWLVLLPWSIATWAWYTGEKLFWRILLILYDVLYYPLYTAWLLIHFALRVALRIVAWALRVAWKILRIPTRIWPVRRWWRTKKMPEIMGQWNAFVRHRNHVRAMRIEKLRRLHALKGENPDRWQADYELRRGFPLPHPEKGRVHIRKRITFIGEVQRARRQGRPHPKRVRPDEPKATVAGAAETTASRAEQPPATEEMAPAPPRKRRPKRAPGGSETPPEPSSV